MRIEKIAKIIQRGLLIGAIVSFLAAFSVSHGLSKYPNHPNKALGYTIPLSVKGVGTVYLDPRKWDEIGVYWDVSYGFFGSLLVFSIGNLLFQGFMKGWRSDGDDNRA